jgi:hypothetical protein
VICRIQACPTKFWRSGRWRQISSTHGFLTSSCSPSETFCHQTLWSLCGGVSRTLFSPSKPSRVAYRLPPIFGSRCYQATVATVHKKIMDLVVRNSMLCSNKTCLSCETCGHLANFG